MTPTVNASPYQDPPHVAARPPAGLLLRVPENTPSEADAPLETDIRYSPPRTGL